MSDFDIQMKKNTDGVWENLYPHTKTDNVHDLTRNKKLTEIINELYTKTSLIENRQSVINVKDFGAKGDGVTDDTQAIQNAINSMTKQRQTIIFPATNGGYYLVNELTIPTSSIVGSYIGIGDARIYFTGKTAFHIQSEFQIFKNLTIWGNRTSTQGNIIFTDERTNKRLDFDIKIIECDLGYAETIVQTWGRGVEILDCTIHDITTHLIHLIVKRENELEFGEFDIQKYKTGYRSYIIKNSRIHYCNQAWMMSTLNDYEKVVQGVTFVNNFIEGGIGYFNGYVRNFLFEGNNHIQADTIKGALFEFAGFLDVQLTVNISGMQNDVDGYVKRINRVVLSTSSGKNMILKGSVRGVQNNVVTLQDGCESITIDLHCADVINSDVNPPSLLFIAGSKPFDGLVVKGIFTSHHATTTVIKQYGGQTVLNSHFSNLVVTGNFDRLSNLTIT